ncbi:hypothetical protein ACFQX6_33220 [Streptosporangium lutulentum]
MPSWCEFSLEASTQVDLFRFSDEPVYDALGFTRLAQQAVEGREAR